MSISPEDKYADDLNTDDYDFGPLTPVTVRRAYLLDDAATERVAATLVRIDSGGMCEYKKVCELCDCHLKYAADTINIRDEYAAQHAKLIIKAIKEVP